MAATNFDGVLVVGGGLSGCSAAYHLTHTKQKVLLLETGIIGWGSADTEVAVKKSAGSETSYKLGVSGTAGVGPVKMVVTQPPRPLSDFSHEHGEQGTRLYLHMSSKGVELEKTLALRLAPQTVHSHGSLCVAFPHHEKDIEADYHTYRKMGVNVELFNADRVAKYHGTAAGFTRGLFFPNDAIIHSAEYARALLKAALATGLLTVKENSARVVRTDDDGESHAIATLANGERIRAHTIVLATGGLFLPDDLKGILRPCWSYFTYLKASPSSFPQPQPHSPNFFTFDFSHDWCVTDGEVRISGEDHFSGMKPPRWKERCATLEAWLRSRYPKLQTPVQRLHYGIYSETPDALPIVGRRDVGSNVVYLLGCNAWGQSILSYCAALVPGILGLKPLDPIDQQLCQFISPMRFTARGKL